MFFGYSTLALAATGILVAASKLWRRQLSRDALFVISFALTLTATSVWASLPRKFTMLGQELPGLAYFLTPVTDLYRVYARFGVLVGLGLIVLAGYALAQLPRRASYGALTVTVLAFTAFELWVGSGRTTTSLASSQTPITWFEIVKQNSAPTPVTRVDAMPAHVEWLARHPGGIVADYPAGALPDGRWSWKDVFYQFRHRHPLWQLAPVDTLEQYIRGATADLDDSRTAGILASYRVKYVVLHRGRYDRLNASIPAMSGGGYRQLTTFAQTGAPIYEVTARAPDRFAIYGPGFFPPEPTWQWLRNDGSVFIHSRRPISIFLTGSARSLRGTRRLDVLDRNGKMVASWEIRRNFTYYRIPVSISAGWSRFTLRVTPGPKRMSEADGRLVSLYMSPIELQTSSTRAVHRLGSDPS